MKSITLKFLAIIMLLTTIVVNIQSVQESKAYAGRAYTAEEWQQHLNKRYNKDNANLFFVDDGSGVSRYIDLNTIKRNGRIVTVKQYSKRHQTLYWQEGDYEDEGELTFEEFSDYQVRLVPIYNSADMWFNPQDMERAMKDHDIIGTWWAIKERESQNEQNKQR